MAGTSGLKWKLLPIAVLASLHQLGESFDLTYRAGSDLWQCVACERVERYLGTRRPYCCGTPASYHPRSKARKVRPRERLEPTDDEYQVFAPLTG